MNKIAFDYFGPKEVLHYLKFLVALNPLFSVTFNIIAIIEIFEKVEVFARLLKDSSGELEAKRIFAARTLLLTVIFLTSLLSADVALIFNLVGSLFGPILGFILPVFPKN